MGRPKKSDMVNHPSHYQQEGRKECIVELEEMFGVKNTAIWCMMTAFKYIYRLGNKDDAEQDLAKAIWYMDYINTLKEKWHTDSFDDRMEQQLEKSIKDAKKKVRKLKKAQKEGFESKENQKYLEKVVKEIESGKAELKEHELIED